MAFEREKEWIEQYNAWNWSYLFEGDRDLTKLSITEWENLNNFYGEGAEILFRLFSIMDSEIWGEQGEYNLKELWKYYRKFDEAVDNLRELFEDYGIRNLFIEYQDLNEHLAFRVRDKRDYLKQTTKINQRHLEKLEKRIRAKEGKIQIIRQQITKQLQQVQL